MFIYLIVLFKYKHTKLRYGHKLFGRKKNSGYGHTELCYGDQWLYACYDFVLCQGTIEHGHVNL